MDDENVISGPDKPGQIDLLRRDVLRQGTKLAYTIPLVLATIKASEGASLSGTTSTTTQGSSTSTTPSSTTDPATGTVIPIR